MSNQIETSFVQQYSDNVRLLCQQKGSKLRPFVSIENVKGKNAFIDQIGSTGAKIKTSRHSDTPIMDTPHSRRRLSLSPYEWADLIDNADKVKMLNDPTSSYAIAAANAMGRAMDAEIYDAALGTAFSGEKGETSVVLPNTQKISASNTGFSFDKLKALKRKFDENDVNEDNRIIVYTGAQLYDLLGEEKATSQEYSAAQALNRGEITEFMGFRFVQVNGTRADGTKIIKATVNGGTTTRHCLAFSMPQLVLGIGEDIVGRISERDDKSYATQVYYEMQIGAVRLEEKAVVQFDCVEA